ncbi:hypothetical protein ACFLTH_15315 [Bacteroidota bacterium]
MTILEIRDNFVARYRLECMKRGTKLIEIGDKMIAYLISAAQQDVLRKIPMMKDTKSVSLTTGTYKYDLDTNFGDVESVRDSDYGELDRVTVKDLDIIEGTTGAPTQYAIEINDNLPQIYFDAAETGKTITVNFSIVPNFYSPSGSTAQDWGSFDGSTFTGDLIVPDRYLEAIILHMLGQMFIDFKSLYDIEIDSLRDAQITNKTSIAYRFNGGIK